MDGYFSKEPQLAPVHPARIDRYGYFSKEPQLAHPARIDRYRAPPPPTRITSKPSGGLCSLGGGLFASLGCGKAEDGPEIEIDALERQYDADNAPPLPAEFSGDFCGAHDSSMLGIYSTSNSQQFAGDVLRSGQVWMITEEPEEVEVVERGELLLYANGLSFRQDKVWGGSSSSRMTVPVVLQPFAFVRPASKHNEQLQRAAPYAKIFAISFYLTNRTVFFAVSGTDDGNANGACLRWVRDVSLSIRWVTESLFARGSCFQASPGPLVSSPEFGAGRLMGGYLMHSETSAHSEVDYDTVRSIFAELHPPREGKASLVLYDEADCNKSPRHSLVIDSRTACYEKVGHDCSCFCVGTLQFSARTVLERTLWLRAIANLKVKLQSRGLDPKPDELVVWRQAINEHIHENVNKLKNRIFVPEFGSRSTLDESSASSFPCKSPGSHQSNPWAMDGDDKGIFDTVQDGPLLRDLEETAHRLRGLPLLRRCGELERAPEVAGSEELSSEQPRWETDLPSFSA